MIRCNKCGHGNPTGTEWCQKAGCGAFLEFVGDPEKTQGIPAVDPGQSNGPPTLVWPPGAGSRPAPPVAGPPPGNPPSTGWPTVDPPPAEPQTEVQQSTKGHAQRVQAPPRGPASNVPPLRPGDVVCPKCGWGNEPARYFCRHDGAVLAGPAKRARPDDPLPAGERRKPPGGGTGNGRWLAIAGVLAILLAVIGGYYRGFFNLPGLDSAQTQIAVTEVSVGGSSTVSTYANIKRGGGYVIDGDISTFWSAQNDDQQPWIRLKFTRPRSITRVEIVNGASGEHFEKRRSAKDIELRFPDDQNKSDKQPGYRKQQAKLENEPKKFQPVEIKTPQLGAWVELRILSFHERAEDKDDHHLRTSISEIRFFTAQ